MQGGLGRDTQLGDVALPVHWKNAIGRRIRKQRTDLFIPILRQAAANSCDKERQTSGP